MDRLNTFFAGDMAKLEVFLHLYSGRFPLKSKCPPGITAIEAVKALLLVDGLEDAARDDVKKHTEEWAASKGPAVATSTLTSTQGLDGANLTFANLTFGDELLNARDSDVPKAPEKQRPATRPALCKSIWKGKKCETMACNFAHPSPALFRLASQRGTTGASFGMAKMARWRHRRRSRQETLMGDEDPLSTRASTTTTRAMALASGPSRTSL
jgi:hypothetical protein